VVVDTLTKSAPLSPVHTMYQESDIVIVFVRDIVILHGVPRNIIFDRGSMFIRLFWTSFQEALGMKLNFNTVYHPKTNRKIERMNQILEDMLCMYVMYQQKCWEDFFPLVKFAYNNSYQSTIKMELF
jgi:transposase InsO family protein